VRIEFGVGLQSDKGPEDYTALGRLTEELGFDVVSVYHDLLYQPAIYPLLLLAQATRCVRLGPAALNPFTLHPVEIAGQIAALDRLSGGRAYLGLTRGAWLDRLGLDQSRPLTALREAVEVIRRLLAGDLGGFAGERFSLAPGLGLAYEPLRRDVPLMIGTWGDRVARWAGEVAQEVKIGGSANPAMVPVMRARIGNDAVGVVLGAVTVCDEDGEAARALARREVAMYVDVVAAGDPTVTLPPGMLDGIRERLEAGDHEGAGALIPDDILDRFAFAGTPERIAAHAERAFRAGARRVEFGVPQGLTTERGLELLGTRVVPAVRASLGLDG
jgi:5,10-methylenetetrahydromethanopterin reductase